MTMLAELKQEKKHKAFAKLQLYKKNKGLIKQKDLSKVQTHKNIVKKVKSILKPKKSINAK